MGEVTLETIYREIMNIRGMLEEFMERTLINVLPEEEIDEKEWEELREIKEEGEYISLREVRRKHGEI